MKCVVPDRNHDIERIAMWLPSSARLMGKAEDVRAVPHHDGSGNRWGRRVY